MVGMVGAMVSFEESHELPRDLAGVEVSAKHVERAAESLGREVAQDERLVVEPPPRQVRVAPTLYLGLDGTGVSMRTSELEGRVGKQPDGITSRTREVKLVTVWSAEGRDPEGTPVRDPRSVSYSAAIQIVDRFHAKQKLSEASKSIYGAESSYGREWSRERHEELDAGAIAALLDALRVHAPQDDEARKCAEYIHRNRERMGYAKFRAGGLCTSTGVVEAGCKVAIGTRCKRAGMHWTVSGADSIISLRCCQLSGRFQGFWQRRSAARLVPAHESTSQN